MAGKMTLKQWLTQLKRHWRSLTGFAIFVTGAIWFIRAPPGVAGGFKEARALGLLVATLTIALQIGIATQFNEKRHFMLWSIILALLLLAAICSYIIYDRAFPRYTCEYRGHLLVIGDVLTPRAAIMGKTLDERSCDELLREFAGEVPDVWTAASINHCRTVLEVEYLLVLTLFAASVVTASHLVRLGFAS